MDYDSFHSAVGTVLILAAVLLCGLHLWFSAAMASVQKLGGQMSALAEDKPKMQYYLKHKNRLRITAVAEVISFTAIRRWRRICWYLKKAGRIGGIRG